MTAIEQRHAFELGGQIGAGKTVSALFAMVPVRRLHRSARAALVLARNVGIGRYADGIGG